MRLAPALLVAAIGVVLLTSTPLSVQQAPFGAYNHDWDGTAHLFESERIGGLVPVLTRGQDLVLLKHGRLAGLDAERHSVLIVGPNRPYTTGEIDHLRSFLQAGGRALIADDTGTATDLVAALELGVTLPGIQVFTPGYSKRVLFPVALDTGLIPGMPPEVVLNVPSVVQGDGEPVLLSPELAWLDANGDGRPTLQDPQGTWAFARLTIVGPNEGKLLVLGDPSIFTTEMQDEDGAAVEALIAWLVPPGRTLVIDEAHRAAADPVGSAQLLSGDIPGPLAVVSLAGALAAVGLVAWRVRLTRKRARAARPSVRVKTGGPLTPLERAVLTELEEGPA